jgi:HD-like signal output (HDOD) protein
MPSIDALLDEFTDMVTFPAVYLRAKQLIDDPESSILDLTKVISVDPGITSRVLRLVNSAIFGFPGKIETVSRAVNMLGTIRIHDLVLTTAVTSAFENLSPRLISMDRFWRGNVYCGLLAQALAGQCKLLDTERLFVEGLLRDVGHLVMYEVVPDLAKHSIERARDEQLPPWCVERELLGFDFAQIGAALFNRWGLPASISNSVGGHTDLNVDNQVPLEAGILHIAGAFSDAYIYKASDGAAISPVAWQLTELDEGIMPSVKYEADQNLTGVLGLILGNRQAA